MANPGAGRAVLVAERRGRRLAGQPLFERGPELQLARGRVQLADGDIVLCRIDRRGAQPVAVLGRAKVARDVVAALLAHNELRPTFPRRLEQEAGSSVRRLQQDGGPRRDLLSLPTFTVDPTTARDFDDAVSARREDRGIRIWVHIADVAAHVPAGSGLDREALARANSTYAPGAVVPMLPRALSDEACSLNPGVERLAVTTELELGTAGEVISASFYRSRIRSDARLDYDGLDRIFAGRERAPEGAAEPLALAREVAAALAARSRGSALSVSSSEPEIDFDEEGNVVSAKAVEQTEAHGLIEQLMILTNRQVASLLERKGVPSVYRVHEQPDPRRIALLLDQLAALDVPTPAAPEAPGPSEAGALAAEASSLVAAEAERRGYGAASLSSLVLRALKPARYSERNLGHAGLGIAAYAHFTSPIRRYPDLVAHRALLSTLGEGEPPPDRHEVGRIGEHCSDREREAMKVERRGDDVCLGFLLERELLERGWEQDFEGEVSGVIGAGAFVRFRGEMADLYEGFLPARRIGGDRYELNDTDCALVGRRSGRRLGIGDPVEVRVESVEAPRGRVDLIPAGSGEEGSRRRSRAPGGRRGRDGVRGRGSSRGGRPR